MSYIYTPKGKAREYSPLALNIYRGCSHGCIYCYVKSMPGQRVDAPYPRKDIVSGLKKELLKTTIRDQVLLSFISDPYQEIDVDLRLTRQCLNELLKYSVPVAILSKGGNRILRDLDIFQDFKELIKVGATLTFRDESDREHWEPGAAPTQERLFVLEKCHQKGIKTWASFEPVIKPEQSLRLIEETIGYIDQYKVGKWNHDKMAEAIDWESFGNRAVEILRKHKKKFYIKNDLRKHITIELSPKEMNSDALALYRKQGEQMLL